MSIGDKICNTMSKRDCFNPKALDELKHYVYCLVDPRDNKIFYVGKGQGQRVFAHAAGAMEKDADSEKIAQIKAILSEGKKIKHYVLRHGLDEETAFEIEAVLIDVLSYPAFNLEHVLKVIQAGHHTALRGIKSSEEINLMYDCPDLEFTSEDNVLFINVNKTYDANDDIYNAVKGYWKLSLPRLQKNPPTVLAHYRRIVRAVYIHTEWFKTEDGKKVCFKGELDENSPFVNKSVKNLKLNRFSGCTYGETALRRTVEAAETK